MKSILLRSAGFLVLGLLASTSAAAPWNPAGADSLFVTILGLFPVNSPQGVGVWDCAAYVDPTGHEFAILGADSVYVIDLADPSRPRRASTIPRDLVFDVNPYVDVAVRGPYCYAAGRRGPIKIIDLTDPYHAVVRGIIPRGEFCACSCGHPCTSVDDAEIETLFIDERGVLYVTGINCGEGMHMYDIATDPIRPRWLCHEHTHPIPGSSYFVHDAYARGGILYVSRSRAGQSLPPRWDILDGDPLCPDIPGPCGDGQRPAMISTFHHNGPELHSHSAWPMDDPRYLTTCDEKENGHVRIWNIANLRLPFQISEVWPDATCHSAHNIYVRGRYGYCAWYNKGIQVIDLADPYHPVRVGKYEHPSRWGDGPADPCCDPTLGSPAICKGIFFMDPFFPSGIFIATEIDSGLLIGRFRQEASAMENGPPPAGDSLQVLPPIGGRGARIVWVRGGVGRDTNALDVYAAGGERVARLQPTDEWIGRVIEFRWDGEDASGRPLPRGVYFVRPESGGVRATGKVVLLD
jgi:hypothetical protein